MKPLLLTLAALLLAAAAPAQSFENALGVRFGYPWSVSFKHFLDDANAVEAYVGTRGYGGFRGGATSLSAAYLHHEDLDLDGDLSPLRWYYGAGASVRFWNYRDGDFRRRNDYSATTLGVSGYLGLQYAFRDVPIELTLDWVPTLHLGRTYINAFGAGQGGLGARYILGR